jgi:hypothetical protein
MTRLLFPDGRLYDVVWIKILCAHAIVRRHQFLSNFGALLYDFSHIKYNDEIYCLMIDTIKSHPKRPIGAESRSLILDHADPVGDFIAHAASVALDVKAILTPPCMFALANICTNITVQGGVRMTLTPTPRRA